MINTDEPIRDACTTESVFDSKHSFNYTSHTSISTTFPLIR